MESAIVLGGKGQVGGAIAEILSEHGTRLSVVDLGLRPKTWEKKSVLHVAIPYSKEFVTVVKSEIKRYKPSLVIVHSTVPVGTTRQLGEMVAHSPVRGQHNDLKYSIMRFIKYVAGVTRVAGQRAFKHLHANGFPAYLWGKPEETELMKLLCLSRYLNDLALYEKAYQLCVDFKVAPNRMLDWTDSYNDGYAKSKYVRPSFTFPMGKVGGHCVMSVSKMLQAQTKDGWLAKNIRLFEPEGIDKS